jgi:hypothetical protein
MNYKDNSHLFLESSQSNLILPPVRNKEQNKHVFGSGIPESTDKEKTKEELERTITNCIIKHNSDTKGLNLKSVASFKTQTSKNNNSFLKREISSYNFKGSLNTSLLNSSDSNRRITIKMSNLLVRKSDYFPDTDDYSNFTGMETRNSDQVNSYYNLSHLKDNCNIMGTHFSKNNSHTRLPFKHTAIKYDHALSKYKYKISDIDLSTDLKKFENEYAKKKKKVNLLNFDPFLNKENFHSKYKFNEAELKQKLGDESFSDYYDSIYSQLGKNFRNNKCSGVESINMKTNYNANYENLKNNLNQSNYLKKTSDKNNDSKNKNYFIESVNKPNQTKIIKTFESIKKLNEIKDIKNTPSMFLNLQGNINSPKKGSYPDENESRNTEDLMNNSPNVMGSKIYEKKIIKVFERVKMIDYKFNKIHKTAKLLLNLNDNKKICN